MVPGSMGPEQSGEGKVRQSPSRIGERDSARATQDPRNKNRARYSGDLKPGDFSSSLTWIAVFSCPIFRNTTSFTDPGGNSAACSSSCFFSAARRSPNEYGIERLRCMTPRGGMLPTVTQYTPELVQRLSCSRLGAAVMRAMATRSREHVQASINLEDRNSMKRWVLAGIRRVSVTA
jgi:hypothetical protein